MGQSAKKALALSLLERRSRQFPLDHPPLHLARSDRFSYASSASLLCFQVAGVWVEA